MGLNASSSATVPSFDALMWPTLRALRSMGGSASNDELLAKVIELERYPDAIASAPYGAGRQTRLGYNLAWAKTYLKKAGAVDNGNRGVWTITEKGESLSPADMSIIPQAVRRQGQDEDDGGRAEDGTLGSDAAPGEPIPGDGWKDQLLAALKAMAPDAFERLAQRILRESGFTKVEVTGRSGDGGIDGVGVLRINLLSFPVYFQCKKYADSVGAGAVRDFRGAMVGRSDKGLILTTGTFSAAAKREATRDGTPPIELIDGDALCDLLKSLKLGVEIRMVESVAVDAGWFARV